MNNLTKKFTQFMRAVGAEAAKDIKEDLKSEQGILAPTIIKLTILALFWCWALYIIHSSSKQNELAAQTLEQQKQQQKLRDESIRRNKEAMDKPLTFPKPIKF